MAAWDFSRVVSLARAAHDAGFISEPQAWQAIERAATAARQDNHSWCEFVASYLIGPALWGGDESLDHFIDVCRRMFADPTSPWCAVHWPGRLSEGVSVASSAKHVPALSWAPRRPHEAILLQ